MLLRRDEHRTKKGHRTKRCVGGERTRGSQRGGSFFESSRRAGRLEEQGSAAGWHRCNAGRDRRALMSREGRTAGSDEYGRWCGCRTDEEATEGILDRGWAGRIHFRSPFEFKLAPAAAAVVLGRGPCRGAGSQRRKNFSLPAGLGCCSGCCADPIFSKT